MTKVVFQGKGYWLTSEYWEEALNSGAEPIFVQLCDGVISTRPATLDEVATRLSSRVAGWSVSADKSISVFAAGLTPQNRAKAIEQFQAAVTAGIFAVIALFTARTGAQGLVRLPAEAKFVLVFHIEAKNGAPQLHAHIAIEPRVGVAGTTQTYATYTRELYQLRKLFSAVVQQELGNRLHREFGLRIEKTEHGIRLPDVPRALCESGADRTKQIDGYIAKHRLKNTPLNRRLAALATRHDNPDRNVGRDAFRSELLRSGFRGESICHRAVREPAEETGYRPLGAEFRRVGELTRRMLRSNASFTRQDLLTRALQTASVDKSFKDVARSTEAVLRSPELFGFRAEPGALGTEVYKAVHAHQHWKKIRERLDYILAEQLPAKTASDGKRRAEQPLFPQDRPTGSRAESKVGRAGDESNAFDTQQSTERTRHLKKILQSYRAIGAVGQAGLAFAKAAVDLYQLLAKPILRVQGQGDKWTEGSLAATVRDLKRLSVIASHKAALRAALKYKGPTQEKLRHAERIYRRSRTPKLRIPKKSLIVIQDVEAAHPRDVRFLMEKAERAKTRVLLVEREWSRSVLLRQAKGMRPGKTRRIPAPEHNH